jgi:hypothetical protein
LSGPSDDAIILDRDGIIKAEPGCRKNVQVHLERNVRYADQPDYSPAGIQAEMTAVYDRIRNGERVEQFDTVRLRKDGTEIEISFSISPLKDETGSVIGITTMAHDITRQREQERALLSFITETAMRLRHPMERVTTDIRDLAAQLDEGKISPAEARMALLIQVRNTEQITRNLIDLNRAIAEQIGDLPKHTGTISQNDVAQPITGQMKEGEILLLLTEGHAIRQETLSVLRELTGREFPFSCSPWSFRISLPGKPLILKDISTDLVFFIDTLTKYSSGPKVETHPQCLFLTSPADMTELGIAVTKMLPRLPPGKQCVVLDDLSMLLLYANSATVLRFMHFLTSKIRLMEKNGVILTTAATPDPFVMSQLQILVDSIVRSNGSGPAGNTSGETDSATR